ncbi:MAG: glycosyltransferase family 9 protein [Candidatus Omnitrophica bacterium]|nr:glycosyltransferase family 9 protein [Candidatus Omnitrophota bacterium]
MNRINQDDIRRVLLISLTNIGDVVLTTSAIVGLRKHAPSAQIDIVVGPNAAGLFAGDPRIATVFIYDKFSRLETKIALIKRLREKRYDVIIDFRESLFPFLLRGRHKIGALHRSPRRIRHMHERHLWKLTRLGISDLFRIKPALWVSSGDETRASILLAGSGIEGSEEFIAVAPGSKSDTKKWPALHFVALIKRIFEELGIRSVLLGDVRDGQLGKAIASWVGSGVANLCGRTSLGELAALIRRSSLLITNDSAPLHMACAVDTFAIGIFGPTDPAKYGPLEGYGISLQKRLDCIPCEQARCRHHLECLRSVTPEEVFFHARAYLASRRTPDGIRENR